MLQLRVHTRSLHHTRYVHTSNELANAFNGFYHDTKILSEEMKSLRSHIFTAVLTKEILEACIDMLGSQLLTGCNINSSNFMF